MRVTNEHSTVLAAPAETVGSLIDSLASSHDRLWPSETWPPMRLDAPLGVGARGGHGPIGYSVEEYEPGARVRFRFTRPRGFDGTHEFAVAGQTLRHSLRMEARGSAIASWWLVFRPLHDALIEDALAKARRECGGRSERPEWSWWVRVLRRLLGAVR